MTREEALTIAGKVLFRIIHEQPAFLTASQPLNSESGKAAAEYCTAFIETYAAYLMTRKT